METLDFSGITIQEVPVVTPDGNHFTLREANGKAATDHRNAIMASTRFGPDGKVTGISDLASVEAKFVAACLWDEKGRNPSSVLVQTWPARVQKQLYEKAKELSDFGEDSPIREALEKVLSLEGSPITLEELSKWIHSQDQSEFRVLHRLLEKPEPKNS